MRKEFLQVDLSKSFRKNLFREVVRVYRGYILIVKIRLKQKILCIFSKQFLRSSLTKAAAE